MGILNESYTISNIGLKNIRINIENCKVIYSGVFDIIKIGEKNKNGRIYDRETSLKLIQQFLELPYRYGCIETVTPYFQYDVLTPETSHAIKNMWIEDNIVKANIDILETMNGRLLLELIKINDLGFATASTGYVNDDYVVELDQFITLYAVHKNEMSYEF